MSIAMRVTEEDRTLPVWVFRTVERRLYDYPLAKEAVEDYPRERQDLLLSQFHPMDEPAVDRGQVGDQTGRKAALLAMRHEIYMARLHMVQQIEAVYHRLTADDQALVRLRYWEHPGWDVETLARELVISRAEFYRRRAYIVRQFALRMGLA